MNNHKDIQRQEESNKTNTSLSDIKSLNNKPFFNLANNKTEKLVTALYMVTDCMDSDDALKMKLRSVGVEVLSLMHSFVLTSGFETHKLVEKVDAKISEILSHLEISLAMGFVSEMNAGILRKEFVFLKNDLSLYSSPQTIPSSFWENSQGHLKDNTELKTTLNVLKNSWSKPMVKSETHNVLLPKKENKNERPERIIEIIKDKKQVSIKDISASFTDCSEKTIQRELNDLVSKGQVKKTGEKRWSRYQLV